MRTEGALRLVAGLASALVLFLFALGRFDRAPPPDLDPRAPRMRGESLPRPERIEPGALGAPPVVADPISAALVELGPVDDETATRSAIRSTLEEAITIHLPELKLSSEELRALADATLRLRRAQAALREMPKTIEHAESRALERRRLAQAVDDFTYLVEMTPNEFTRRVAPGSGIDEWSPDGPPGQVELRPIASGSGRTRE